MNILSQAFFTPNQSDVDAIQAFVAAFEHAQQNERVDEFISFFLPEAVWTTAHGKRLEGRDEIAAFTRKVLPGAMATSKAIYRIERIFFVTPEVAVVNIRQQPIDLDGNPLADIPEGRPVQILYKSDGAWKIAAAQNTQVVSE